MRKALIRFIFELLFAGIASGVIGTIAIRYNIIDIPQNMSDFQTNIITIVTVFAGFSFSVLGLLISLSATRLMEKLVETSELEKSCIIITKSIIVFMLTFFFALYFASEIYLFMKDMLGLQENIPYSIELGYLLFGIVIFLCSVYRMTYMLKFIFAENKKDVPKKIEKFNEAVSKFNEDKQNFIEDDE